MTLFIVNNIFCVCVLQGSSCWRQYQNMSERMKVRKNKYVSHSWAILEYSVKVLARMKQTGKKWNKRNTIEYAQCIVLVLILKEALYS
jgi:uncharacterized membrane protein